MKVGDNIVCVDVDDLDKNCLTMGKIYRVKHCFDYTNGVGIIDNKGANRGYYLNRFISLSENRKLKLNKINGKR